MDDDAGHGGARDGAGGPHGHRRPRVSDADFGKFTEFDDALDYIRAVMKDPDAHPLRRDEMAKLLAQYTHAKPEAEKALGKKAQRRQDGIDKASGRYERPPPPKAIRPN